MAYIANSRETHKLIPPKLLLSSYRSRLSPTHAASLHRYRLVTSADFQAEMDEEERKARDQQLRSSIHTKLIESGEYDRYLQTSAAPPPRLHLSTQRLGVASG